MILIFNIFNLIFNCSYIRLLEPTPRVSRTEPFSPQTRTLFRRTAGRSTRPKLIRPTRYPSRFRVLYRPGTVQPTFPFLKNKRKNRRVLFFWLNSLERKNLAKTRYCDCFASIRRVVCTGNCRTRRSDALKSSGQKQHPVTPSESEY